MSPLVTNVNQILSLLTVAGQVIIVLILAAVFLKKAKAIQFIAKHAILFSFIVALTATLGSLFFSEIAKFEPCKLCWFQRILIYPQVILFGIAIYKKERVIVDYALWLSVIGMAIAAYHYLLQIGVAPELNCSVTGYSASCSKRFIMSFGYVTIPMMAFTAFAMNILFGFIQKRHKTTN